MGRSDSFIFQAYRTFLDGKLPDPLRSIAFLGFTGENDFTRTLPAPVRDFYDIQLGNWDINTSWEFPRKYDLIVSTRCPYFCKTPVDMLHRCLDHLAPGGRVFLDWGLGDHWRFERFRVGWVSHGEHESVPYAGRQNHLWSCFWNDDVERLPASQQFLKAVRRWYPTADDLKGIVMAEVPSILLDDSRLLSLDAVFLWPEAPQLYILTLFG